MSGISYQDEVEEAVYREGAGKVFAASAIYKNKLGEIPEFTYYKSLERMVNRNKLIRLAKGLYLRPGYDTGEEKILEELIRYHTAKEGNYVYGFRAGEYLLKKYKLADDIREQEILVYTARMKEKSRRVQKLSLHQLPAKLDEKMIPYMELMELLTGYENYRMRADFHPAAFEQLVRRFAAEYEDHRMQTLLRRRQYPKRIIAFLRALLQQLGRDNTLGQFLAGTSRYRIPELPFQGKENGK